MSSAPLTLIYIPPLSLTRSIFNMQSVAQLRILNNCFKKHVKREQHLDFAKKTISQDMCVNSSAKKEYNGKHSIVHTMENIPLFTTGNGQHYKCCIFHFLLKCQENYSCRITCINITHSQIQSYKDMNQTLNFVIITLVCLVGERVG